MKTAACCPVCDAVLPLGESAAGCPKCLLIAGLEAIVESSAGSPSDGDPTQASQSLTPLAAKLLGRFGDYELLEEIARGGMGVVFKARQLSLNRLVALKLISAGALATDELVRRFKMEAEAAASLSHPNIVPVYEIGEHEGQHYFSMALIDGQDLSKLRGRFAQPAVARKLDSSSARSRVSDAVRLLSTIARAVHYAHARGVLHRDLKPGNILLDADGQPHLTDFGLAKIVEKESTLTCSNAMLGTPAYMAPEQARGEPSNITITTDVYGLGAVLYDLLTGTPPFSGRTSVDTIRQVVEEEPRRPSLVNPLVDRDVETICLRCLDKSPHRRYGSALSLAEDLERWLRREPIQARPSTGIERAAKWVHRRPAVAGLSFLLVLAILAGLGVSLWQWRAQVLARRLAERGEAYAQLNLAETFLQNTGLKKARDILLDVPEHFRHWEWGYLLGRSVMAMRTLEGHRAPITAAAFGSDDTWLASGDSEGQVQVWDLRTGTSQLRLARKSGISALALNSLSNQVTALCLDGSWALWDGASGHLLAESPPFPNLAFASLSADGRRCLRATASAVQVIDTQTGAQVQAFSGLPPPQHGAVLSPDGQQVAIASGARLSIYEVESGRLRCNLPLELKTRPTLTFSRDGRQILCGTEQAVLALFQTDTGELIRQTSSLGTTGDLNALLSPDGSWMALRDSGYGIEIRDGRTFEKLRRYGWDQYDLFLSAVSADGRWIASGTEAGMVRIWRVQTDQRPLPHNAAVTGTALSRNENLLATGCADGMVTVWESRTGRRIWAARGHFQWVTDAAFSRDDQVLATASVDRTVRLWQPVTGTALGVIEHPTSVQSLAFHPDGQRLFTAGADGVVRVWGTAGKKQLDAASVHASPICRMILSPDGRLLAAGSRDGRTKILDAVALKELSKLPKQDHGISALAFDASSTRLAVSSYYRTEIWEARSGRYVHGVETHGICGGSGFSPDGERLITASGCPSNVRGNSRIEIWDVADSRQKKPRQVLLLEEKGIAVWATAFASDGRRFYVGGDSCAVSVWDALPWRAEEYSGSPREPFRQRLDRFLESCFASARAANVPSALELIDQPVSLQHPRSSWPARDTATPSAALDLTVHYNGRLDIGWAPLSDPLKPAQDLASLAAGLATLGGVRFDIRGVIQLAGAPHWKGFDALYPTEVKGISVDRHCERLHFLHAAQEEGMASDSRVASYIIHYLDGTQKELPVLLGRDLADWRSDLTNGASAASEVWQGKSAASKSGGHVRLFLSTRANPFPKKEIRCIDFVSAQLQAAPFLVAVSLE